MRRTGSIWRTVRCKINLDINAVWLAILQQRHPRVQWTSPAKSCSLDSQQLLGCRRAKFFYLPQPGIEPRLLDQQANILPRRCKSRLLPQGSRSVSYTYTLWYTPPPISNLSLNFLVQESCEMRPREIFMHRTAIGWVINGGRHCRRAKIFYLPQPGIEPRLLDLQANILPRRCKSRLLPQGSRRVSYTYTLWQGLLAITCN